MEKVSQVFQPVAGFAAADVARKMLTASFIQSRMAIARII